MLQCGRDILFQIVTKLDNETLSKLLCPELWSDIRTLLIDPHFWYTRAHINMILTLEPRQIVDWRRVYYLSLISTPLDAYAEALDNLQLMKIAIQLHGIQSFSVNKTHSRYIWSRLMNKEVLLYLLDIGSLRLSYKAITLGLLSATEHGVLEIVEDVSRHGR